MSARVSTLEAPNPNIDQTNTTSITTAAKPALTSPPSLAVSLSVTGSAGTRSTAASRSGASQSVPSSPNHSTRGSASASPRVVFGAGTIARLPTELGRLRLSSPLIVSSPSRIGLARRVQALIPNLDSSILDSALVSVPQRVVEEAVGRVSDRDCVISIGGTSAVKLAGAIGSRKKIPHICVPASYSASEAPLLGLPRRRESKSTKSRRHKSDAASNSGASSGSSSKRSSASVEMDNLMRPAIVIYDEELTNTSTPMTISVSEDSNPVEELRHRRDPKDDDSQWSYLHLPGV